jgi:hypothetical protein
MLMLKRRLSPELPDPPVSREPDVLVGFDILSRNPLNRVSGSRNRAEF